ncbi:hypothetical protein LEM8419_01538 [Neolewinella maritima]|uniref:PA14 domain-containing protein n=2 Tax=Neolewinella maritima TaxID=1383882 RepID=A0ABM9AZX3_9BACT|nr:hypothetical protein LEM8419_01538 [Neolewinella maritima]
MVETEERAPSDGLSELTELPTGDGWTASDGVVMATGPATLELLPAAEAFTVAFTFRMDNEARAELRLGEQFALSLPGMELGDSTQRRSVATVRPDVWQDLEVAYQPARNGAPPVLVAAYLNGNLVYYQEELEQTGVTASPLTLALERGTMSISDVRSIDRAGPSSTLSSSGEVVLRLPLIRYSYATVDGDPEDFTDWISLNPDQAGYIGRFDLGAIRTQRSGYAVRFTSALDVPKADTYTFRMGSPSSTRLYVNDRLVIDLGGRDSDREGEGQIELSEGSHDLRIDHYQYSNETWLNLAYLTSEGEAVSLNDLSGDEDSIDPPRRGETRELATDDRPYLLRSFMNFPPGRVYDQTDKRTHVISVGESDGPHYSYDLHSGSLLQVWRGPFVDVAEMWVGRGQAQVARPLGSVIAFDGRPQWSTAVDTWPDSVSELHHLRYELDAAGRPTFLFDLAGTTVSDQILPTGEGVQRTLANTDGTTAVYTQLASARRIQETAPGSFELRGPGATIDIDAYGAGGLHLLRGERTDRLVAELPAGEQITYRIEW